MVRADRAPMVQELAISIFKRLFGKPQPASTVDVTLGAFGKHPAWDDHTEFLGSADETLLRFQRVLYHGGIAGNVESGAWDKLSPDQRLQTAGSGGPGGAGSGGGGGFDHALVWWLGGRLIVARLWSSTDGKGRGKYPMVACLHAPGGDPESTISTALSLLASLRKEIRTASTQSQVRHAVERAAHEARPLGAAASAWSRDTSISGSSIARLARTVNAHDSPDAFARSLYALWRELPQSYWPSVTTAVSADDGSPAPRMVTPGQSAGGGPMGTQPGPADTRTTEQGGGGGGSAGLAAAEGWGRPVHVRLPRGDDDASVAIAGWLAVLLAQAQPGAAYLLIAPEGLDAGLSPRWVDLVVGEPQTAHLHCLCASPAALPLVSEVPYSLEQPFMSRIAEFIAYAGRVRRIEVRAPAPKSSSIFGPKVRSWSAMLAVAAAMAAGQGYPGPALAGVGVTHALRGVQPTAVTAGERYNDLLRGLKEAVSESGIADDRVRELARKFVSDVEALPGGVIYLREVDDTVDAIMAAVKPKTEGQDRPRPEAGRIGPGMLPGVTHTVLDADRVRFQVPVSTGETQLEFFRVAMPGKNVPVWLSVDEVSAGQFEQIVRSFGSFDELHKIMPPFRPAEDERIGPRVWRWQWARRPGAGEPFASGFEPAAEWLRRSELPGGGEVYPEGLDAGRPSLDMPMQHISPDAAVYAAQLLRCRLPTREEWAVAWGRLRPEFEPNAANLRDATWARQRDHVSTADARGRRLPAATTGMFVRSIDGEPSEEVWDSNDGVLWLSAIGGAAAKPVTSLAGNVSEFVIDLPEEADVSSPQAIRTTLNAAAAELRIAGCSAVGPKGDPGDAVAVILSEAREGFADVGFRLAFSGVGEGPATLANRIASILDPLPLLKRGP